MSITLYKAGDSKPWKNIRDLYTYKSGWKLMKEVYVYKNGWKSLTNQTPTYVGYYSAAPGNAGISANNGMLSYCREEYDGGMYFVRDVRTIKIWETNVRFSDDTSYVWDVSDTVYYNSKVAGDRNGALFSQENAYVYVSNSGQSSGTSVLVGVDDERVQGLVTTDNHAIIMLHSSDNDRVKLRRIEKVGSTGYSTTPVTITYTNGVHHTPYISASPSVGGLHTTFIPDLNMAKVCASTAYSDSIYTVSMSNIPATLDGYGMYGTNIDNWVIAASNRTDKKLVVYRRVNSAVSNWAINSSVDGFGNSVAVGRSRIYVTVYGSSVMYMYSHSGTYLGSINLPESSLRLTYDGIFLYAWYPYRGKIYVYDNV